MQHRTAKRITIGSALTVVVGTAIGSILTPAVMMWIAIVIGIGLLSTILSWGTTAAFKKFALPPTPWGDPMDPDLDDAERARIQIYHRRTYAWAMATGGLYNALGGVVLTLIQVDPNLVMNGHWKFYLVMVTLWLLYCLLIAVSSPYTWRWTFEHLVPALNRKVDSAGVDIRRGDDGKIDAIKDGHNPTEFLRPKPPRQDGHADWGFLIWIAASGICLLFAIVCAGLGFAWPWLWVVAIVLAAVAIICLAAGFTR